jgi:hypothetical protein
VLVADGPAAAGGAEGNGLLGGRGEVRHLDVQVQPVLARSTGSAPSSAAQNRTSFAGSAQSTTISLRRARTRPRYRRPGSTSAGESGASTAIGAAGVRAMVVRSGTSRMSSTATSVSSEATAVTPNTVPMPSP